LVALLPVLGKSLASERQRRRVEEGLAEVNLLLEHQAQAVKALSDAQYKLINETILTFFHTTDAAKLQFLRSVVQNALALTPLEPLEAAVLSRIIRDISAEEAAFFAHAYRYQAIRLVQEPEPEEAEVLKVVLSSQEARCVSGLISLGILASGGGRYIDLGQLRFMPIAAKLLVVLRQPGKPNKPKVPESKCVGET
jgi:hypothetical protein